MISTPRPLGPRKSTVPLMYTQHITTHNRYIGAIHIWLWNALQLPPPSPRPAIQCSEVYGSVRSTRDPLRTTDIKNRRFSTNRAVVAIFILRSESSVSLAVHNGPLMTVRRCRRRSHRRPVLAAFNDCVRHRLHRGTLVLYFSALCSAREDIVSSDFSLHCPTTIHSSQPTTNNVELS